MTMRLKQSVLLVFGILLVLAGIALQSTGIAVESTAVVALVSAGVVMVIVAVITGFSRQGEVLSDERTKGIGAYGTTYSWVLTLILILAFLWLDFLGLASFDLQGTLLVLLFTMLLSARIFQWYLSRQGDVA